MMSRTSPSTLAASAALASPGPIAAATSAGVEPSGISLTDPSGSAILNIFVMRGRHVATRGCALNWRDECKACLTVRIPVGKASFTIRKGHLAWVLELLRGGATT